MLVTSKNNVYIVYCTEMLLSAIQSIKKSLKGDWKVNKCHSSAISNLLRPFSEHSVDWMVELYPVMINLFAVG